VSELDPFISPCVAFDSMLEKLPKISILGGSYDPLGDDAVYFVHRLKLLGRTDVRLRILDAMPHGFLHMASASRDAKEGMLMMGSWMAEYLEIPFEHKGPGGTTPEPSEIDEVDMID